jgi:glycosyltransferase involved in cell wall biosynthesis
VTSWVCALKRSRFVYYAADVWTDGVRAMGAHRLVIGIMERLERRVLRRADVVLSASDVMSERLIELGADPSRVVTVRNGVDTSIFRPDAVPAAPDELYFAYTGTMSEWQQPDVFIHAFKKIADRFPDLRLRFFGQGSQEQALKELADELVPGRVSFGGLVPPAASAQWIRGAVGSLVSLVPGIGYDSAQPTKAFAGAACGTPVLFAGAEPAGRLVTDAGLGIATGFDADEISEGMAALVESWSNGTTESLRSSRASWAEENASLAAVGMRGTRAILGLVGAQVTGR